MKTHLQVASLASRRGDPEGGLSLEQAQQGVFRLQRTLDQLLLLARLDGGVDQDPGGIAKAGEAARRAASEALAVQGGEVAVQLKGVAEDAAVAVPEALLVAAIGETFSRTPCASRPKAP